MVRTVPETAAALTVAVAMAMMMTVMAGGKTTDDKSGSMQASRNLMKNILTAAASTPPTRWSPHPGLNRWPRGHSKTTKKERTKWKL